MLKGNPDVRVQALPLRSQTHSATAAGEQGTAQRRLQVPDGAGQIGLSGKQQTRRLRQTAVLGYIVEYAVIVAVDVHNASLLYHKRMFRM